ncbi:1-acyl-sn-glycerol-3-phosphate acyltransferase [Aurantiacibacter gangjinensis]|uniref:Uncharacterized protein n=1 Tax=Aurantiacibacter gangjinensis TaxID=502682 RepID=A0A0G9MKW3_9SPHN|nr:1-acyl-sn-glycerol-3-phosphate acyltransferase [Aurantiacibacter gangjinensis]APE27252.1 acyltransferase family protein [Aurantiacibacter gangjinensis]KLE31371.1 hypothetical protein AAW01_07130 [Aurantiacibacter gangjinensis]
MKGFSVRRSPPDIPKFIFLGAPHTSNWDFIYFAGAVRDMGVKPSFLGKHTLFKWPMTRFMKDMGGTPVDRSRKGGYVQAVADAFAQADELALVIAPEGSRESDGRWRSGFYHMAMAAQVPIVPVSFDIETGVGVVGDPVMPTGDFHADLEEIAAFYKTQMPHCPRFDTLAAQARGELDSPGRQRESVE